MSTLLKDQFIDTTGTSLASHTMEVGSGWSILSGTWKVESNFGALQDTANAWEAVVSDAGQADVTVTVNFTLPVTSGWNTGICLRATDNSNYLMLVLENSSLLLYRKTTGSFTQVGTTVSVTATAGKSYTMQLTGSGTTVTGYFGPLNNATQQIQQTITQQSTATKHGLVANQGSLNTATSVSLFQTDTGSGPAATVVVTSPVIYQTLQRNSSGLADIAVSGTYTGSPTAIEARFNGGSFATIVASPSAGSFSGTLTGQAQGQGLLTVRFTNDHTVSIITRVVGIGDVFVIAGQSNAVGHGLSAQSYSTYNGLIPTSYPQGGVWQIANDPVSNGTVPVLGANMATSVGSVWPIVGGSLCNLLGYPVAFICTAADGTGLFSPSNWLEPTGACYTNCIAQAAAAGTGSNGVKAVLYYQGETDIMNSVSLANYQTAAANLFAALTANITGSPPVFEAQIASYGAPLGTGDPTNVRTAQANLWNTSGVYAGPSGTTPDLGTSGDGGASADGVHWKTSADLLVLASRWLSSIVPVLYPKQMYFL